MSICSTTLRPRFHAREVAGRGVNFGLRVVKKITKRRLIRPRARAQRDTESRRGKFEPAKVTVSGGWILHLLDIAFGVVDPLGAKPKM